MNPYKIRFSHVLNGKPVEDVVFLAFGEWPSDEYARKRLEGISWVGSPVGILTIDWATEAEINAFFATKYNNGLDALHREIMEAQANHIHYLTDPDKNQPSLETQLAEQHLKTLLQVQKLFHA